MTAQLRQARAATKKIIDENPSVVTYARVAMVDDGMDGECPDPFGSATTYKARVRLAHESGGVQKQGASPAGTTANLSMFLLMDHAMPIREGEVITDPSGQGWTVGVVNVDRRYGGVVGASAPLTKADAIPEGV